MRRLLKHPIRNGFVLVAVILLAADVYPSKGGDVFAVLALGLYWLPTLIGWRRHVPNLGSVAVTNFFAWALLVPWVIALAMAARSVPASQERERLEPPGGRL